MKKFLLGMFAACAVAPAVGQELVYKVDFAELDKFPFYVMGYEPAIIDGVLTSENPLNDEGGAAWYQYFIADGIPTEEGENYTAVVTCKASEPISCALNFGWGWGEGQIQNGSIYISDKWTDAQVSYTEVGVGENGCNLVLQPGTSMAKIEIKEVKVYHGEAPQTVEKEWVSIISNGNADNGFSVNLISRLPGQEDQPAAYVKNPDGEGDVFVSPIAADPDQPWSSQFFIKFNEPVEAGTEMKVSFDYYCSDERTIETQAHGNPGAYHNWECLGNLNAKPEWQTLKKSVVVGPSWAGEDGFGSIAFNLSTIPDAGDFYINNVVVEIAKEKSSGVQNVNAVVAPAGSVYNFQGVKVANSIDEVTVPGLYISNGKKVIKK